MEKTPAQISYEYTNTFKESIKVAKKLFLTGLILLPGIWITPFAYALAVPLGYFYKKGTDLRNKLKEIKKKYENKGLLKNCPVVCEKELIFNFGYSLPIDPSWKKVKRKINTTKSFFGIFQDNQNLVGLINPESNRPYVLEIFDSNFYIAGIHQDKRITAYEGISEQALKEPEKTLEEVISENGLNKECIKEHFTLVADFVEPLNFEKLAKRYL